MGDRRSRLPLFWAHVTDKSRGASSFLSAAFSFDTSVYPRYYTLGASVSKNRPGQESNFGSYACETNAVTTRPLRLYNIAYKAVMYSAFIIPIFEMCIALFMCNTSNKIETYTLRQQLFSWSVVGPPQRDDCLVFEIGNFGI